MRNGIVVVRKLKGRAKTGDSKERTKSLEYLAAIMKKNWYLVYMGLLITSDQFQMVEVLPWEVISAIKNGVAKLNDMAAQLEFLNTNVSTDTISSISSNWPILSEKIDDHNKAELKKVTLKQDA